MKKLYRFFIFVYMMCCFVPATFGFSIVLFSGNKETKSTNKINTHSDSLKSHPLKAKDLKPFKSSLLFISSKPSFYNKYLLGTLGPNTIAFHKIDTTSYPLNTNLSNIQVTSPIRDEMTLTYSLVQENVVTAKLFSVLGNEVTTLFSERQNPGYQSKTFNISDRVSSGIYILRLTVGSQRIAKRIQVL